MSSIQKKPFIEKVIATLTEAEKTALVGLINGGDLTPEFRSLVNRTYKVTASDKGVTHVILETESGRNTGYLVYTDDYCVFIGYQDIQELTMLNINVTHQTCVKVDEPLTITELRFELSGGGSIGEDVTADEINSENATLGQVLTANGSGGASWEDNVIVEGNPEVPSGTTPTDLTGLKVGNTYYKTGIPTVTIALSQVVSADPVQVQLTNEQYAVFENNKQVMVDMTALDPTLPVVIWEYFYEMNGGILFGFISGANVNAVYNYLEINVSNKTMIFETGDMKTNYEWIKVPSAEAGKLLMADSSGYCNLTNALPILTTAPSSANTEGGLIIVVLSSEPATKYAGYLYVVVGNN